MKMSIIVPIAVIIECMLCVLLRICVHFPIVQQSSKSFAFFDICVQFRNFRKYKRQENYTVCPKKFTPTTFRIVV